MKLNVLCCSSPKLLHHQRYYFMSPSTFSLAKILICISLARKISIYPVINVSNSVIHENPFTSTFLRDTTRTCQTVAENNNFRNRQISCKNIDAEVSWRREYQLTCFHAPGLLFEWRISRDGHLQEMMCLTCKVLQFSLVMFRNCAKSIFLFKIFLSYSPCFPPIKKSVSKMLILRCGISWLKN